MADKWLTDEIAVRVLDLFDTGILDGKNENVAMKDALAAVFEGGNVKETSPEISSIAAKYSKFNQERLNAIFVSRTACDQFCSDLRRMSMSLISQDETKGQE